MKEKNLSLIGDFLRYCIIWLLSFMVIGIIFSLINGFSWAAVLLNPLAYSVGISLIIIVLKYDFAELVDYCGFSKKPVLPPAIKYSQDVQEIAMLLSSCHYRQALRKTNLLLNKEPQFPTALNLRGEILLNGFKKTNEARKCFLSAKKYSQPGDEDYRLSEALLDASFDR